jgi:NAD-reducing hydrogenase small subunit
MSKPRVATDWLGGCSGCHMSLLDMDERLIELLQKVELTSSPITDLKVPPESGVDVGVLEGAVNNDEHVHTAKRMRERCKILVALGDCAVFGGVVNMRNYFPMEESLRRAYIDNDSTVDGLIPGMDDIMKPISARAVDKVVKVDVYLPGCPPTADQILYVLSELAEGRIPKVVGEELKYE